MTRAHGRGDAGGFVLVELLVALALAGLVTLLLLSGIRLASFGLDRLSTRAAALDQRRGIETLLRHQLAAAITFPGGAAAVTGFVGEPSSLRFLTLVADSGAGLYRVDLDFDATRADRPLVLTRRHADTLVAPDLQQSVLARHLRTVQIAYFGADSGNAEPAWHRRWDAVRYLPQLVRVTIDAGDGIAHPPIVIRLWAAPS